MKAPSGGFIPNSARHSRGVSLHRGPPAPKAENQRSPALVRADFDDSVLSVAHLRWVCWHYFGTAGESGTLRPGEFSLPINNAVSIVRVLRRNFVLLLVLAAHTLRCRRLLDPLDRRRSPFSTESPFFTATDSHSQVERRVPCRIRLQ
jgi:hypothetical protein